VLVSWRGVDQNATPVTEGSHSTQQADGPGLFLDGPSLVRRARPLSSAYAAARPFPHIVVDGLFGEAAARQLAGAFPGPAAARWKYRDFPEQRRYGQLQQTGFAGVAPLIRHALGELNGMAFLDFLEALTGVRGLIPDPHFVGAGLLLTPPGGFLGVHADFDRDRRRGLRRALTALVYLNPDWDDAWGGHLELWDEDATAAVARISPRCDRLVVMAHGDRYFHGQPVPLACPPDRFRAALAAYFYVADGKPGADAHGAIWRVPAG
jgi:hypothetical protein